MFEKNEKLELLKKILDTREGYAETVKNLDLDEKGKEILLLASVHIKKKNIDQKLIDQAYNIVVKKSIGMDGVDQHADDGKVVEEVVMERISSHDPSSNRKIQIPENPRKINLSYGLIFVIVLIIFFIYQKGFFGGGELQVIDASKLQDRNGIFYTVNETDPYTGIAEKYYSGGVKKEEIVVLDGLVKCIIKWNSRGKKKSESYNIDGEKYTMLIDWYENSQKKVEKNYIDGKLDGLLVAWYENGQKEAEENYIDDKLNGLLVAWYENGQKKMETNAIDDKLYGSSVLWYENGKKKAERNYIDGKQNGPAVFWYKNGQKIEGNFIDGKRNGHGVTWYENGKKKEEGNFIDGKQNGLWVYWYENGQKESEGNYIDDKQNGPVVYWYENGQKKRSH